MPVPKQVLDGTMAYGSRPITINGLPYIANNIRINRPVTEAKDSKALGDPGRRRATADWEELTAELQLASAATVYPKFGDQFTLTVDSNYGAETWVLDPVPHNEDNGEGNIRVLAITAKKVKNGITVVN